MLSLIGHLGTQVNELLSANKLKGQKGTQVQVVLSPKVNGFIGHIFTHRQVELSAYEELGQMVTQVLEIGSAYVPEIQNGMHLIVIKLPNELGYYGHLVTHFIVELSVNNPP